MQRLVCRSAPLPTTAIAQRMEHDHWWNALCIEAERLGRHPVSLAQERVELIVSARRTVVASPEDTDNGQCWSEEIFSLL